MIRVSGESKSRLVKAAGAESCGQRRHQKLHAAVARSTFSSENVQNTSAPDHFLQFRCRKIARCCGEKRVFKSKCRKHVRFRPLFEVEMLKNCTAVARSTFPSQNVKKLWASEHVLKFRCPKNARRCGQKHISKSKCTKYLCFGALFEAQMSRN